MVERSGMELIQVDEMFSLKGKTAFITGSSRGIGKSIAKCLARNGCNIILHGKSQSTKLTETIQELKEYGTRVECIIGDTSAPTFAQFSFDTAMQKFDKIDILILNASIEIRNNFFNVTSDEYDLQMNINVKANFFLVQKFLPSMKENAFGRIITIGSTQQKKAVDEMTVYASGKVMLAGFSRNIAKLVAKNNITVNNVAPGAINTDRTKDVLSDKDYLKKVEGLIPMGYIGEPSDVDGVVLLLCSDAGRYITGEDIFVDGGKNF